MSDLDQAREHLKFLEEGNQRFVAGEMRHPNQSPQRRERLVDRQGPMAVVVACADSRVTPEIVFDVGLGDLFVVRVAGNVVDELVIGSVEYALTALSTPLVVVLGHTNCGAVKAALERQRRYRFLSFSLSSLVTAIQPAIDRAREGSKADDDVLGLAVRHNATIMAERLVERSSIAQHLVRRRQLLVLPAVYDLRTGEVEWLDPVGT